MLCAYSFEGDAATLESRISAISKPRACPESKHNGQKVAIYIGCNQSRFVRLPAEGSAVHQSGGMLPVCYLSIIGLSSRAAIFVAEGGAS